MKQKLAYRRSPPDNYEVESTQWNVWNVPYHISWQRIAIRFVVTVDYGHFSCRHNSRTGLSKQNVYVNELK